jgi:hypothetical protein
MPLLPLRDLQYRHKRRHQDFSSMPSAPPEAIAAARSMSSTRRIVVEALPQSKMRYGTIGDWFERDGDVVIQAVGVDPLSHDEAFLVALHELVEMKLCAKAGITQKEVDAFDAAHKGDGEPGDEWNAPYREQHRKAMIIEHLMANFLGITDYGSIE